MDFGAAFGGNMFKKLLFALVLGLAAQSFAALTYPGCADLSAANFKITPLFKKATSPWLWEPVKLSFQTNNGAVDVYWTELRKAARVDLSQGTIRVYRGATKTIDTIGSIPVGGQGNDGLVGLAFHPKFQQNGWIFVQYSTPYVGNNTMFRLSRFTIKGGKLDNSTEKVILENIAAKGQVHTGGALQFDSYGDLWWTMGDNMDLTNGPANSKDLRGKLMRIRPIDFDDALKPAAGNGSTYTIPTGSDNFGEFFAKDAEKAGNAARAAQFRDKALVRPEIFAMGMRNPYTLTLDPVRRWATDGACGPDNGKAQEEDNLITAPVFLGYPYFAGNQIPIVTAPIAAPPGRGGGITPLPPAVAPLISYQQACAMTGPIYRYNPNLNSPVKMPPHFDRVWFTTEFNLNYIHAHKLNEQGTAVTETIDLTGAGGIFAAFKSQFFNPIDFQEGPDGAFYVLNYNGFYTTGTNAGIVKIEYIGPACNVAAGFKFEKAGCMTSGDPAYDPTATHHNPLACGVVAIEPHAKNGLKIALTNKFLRVDMDGAYTARIMDIQGREVAVHQLAGGQTVSLSDLRPSGAQGLWIIKLEANGLSESHRVYFP